MTAPVPFSSAETELKRAKALELRARHATYRQIGTALGCDVAYAYRLVKDAMAELRQHATETAEEIRRLEMERLDELGAKLQQKLDRQVEEVPEKAANGTPTGRTFRYANPDEDTVKAILAVMRRRADLLGLDARDALAARLIGDDAELDGLVIVRHADGHEPTPGDFGGGDDAEV